MECVCGFSCGTADAFLRHVEAERIRMGDTMEEEKVGMSTHELVESGGLPILPPPRKGSVAANMAKRRDRARSLEIPFTCDACGFSCGTMAAWMRHQGRMHGAPLCTPCEEKSSAMQHTSPEQLTLKKYRNEDKTQGSDTTRADEDIPLIIGPVAASAGNTHTSSPAWIACSEQTLSTRLQRSIDVSFVETDVDEPNDENSGISSPSSPSVVWSAQLIRGTGPHSRKTSGKTMSRLARSTNPLPLEERGNIADNTEEGLEFPVR